jgi:hypothetical protein
MIRGFLTLWLVMLGSAAIAQTPGYQYPFAPAPSGSNFLPNYYNRQTQPLSPYLNLLRGGNPGVNYFYGVRPGLPSGGMMPGAMGGFGGGNSFMQQRMGYLPAGANPEPTQLPAAGRPLEPNSLPPSSHPVYFVGATAFSRPFPNTPNMAAPRTGILGNSAPNNYTPRRR